MAGTIRSVQQEHERFLPSLQRILDLADGVGHTPLEQVRARTGEVQDFLTNTIMPHAVAEGRVLFPYLREGHEGDVQDMTRCHRQLAQLTDELEAVRANLDRAARDPDTRRELRRVLYGLHALLSAHFQATDELFEMVAATKRPPRGRTSLFAHVEGTAQEVEEQFE